MVCYAEDNGVVKTPGTNHGWMLDGTAADEAQFARKNNATAASITVAVAIDSLSDLMLVTSPAEQLATSEHGTPVPVQIQLKFKPQVTRHSRVFCLQFLDSPLLVLFWQLQIPNAGRSDAESGDI